MLTNVLYSRQALALDIPSRPRGRAVTEDQARAICAELGATLSIRKRKGIPYVYVARWLPRAAVEAAGRKTSKSRGQQFDRYVAPLARLDQVDEETLRQRIAELPQNPNKSSSQLEHRAPPLSLRHTEIARQSPVGAFRPARRRRGKERTKRREG